MKEVVTKKYVDFAVDNGYGKYSKHNMEYKDFNILKNGTFGDIEYTVYFNTEGAEEGFENSQPTLDIITSKEFLKAITKGLNPTMREGSMGFDMEMDGITTKQAIAIRDGKLEEFIENLLINNNY